MKGFVPTPAPVVDLMVEKLFRSRGPMPETTILDPGCGPGAFIDGVIRWCARHQVVLPSVVGVDSDSRHVRTARARFSDVGQVQIRQSDFLSPSMERFDFIIGNPPYVPITGLTTGEREEYRSAYESARGRFDLYLLFFEQALRLLNPRGRLVFITPEKFLYVDTAEPLRNLFGRLQVEELHLLPEQTFGTLVTYPLVSTVVSSPSSVPTRVIHRDGRVAEVWLGGLQGSWLPAMTGAKDEPSDLTLADLCTRISCGVATGADAVFVVRSAQLDPHLRGFARPTIAGRQIANGKALKPLHSILLPYGEDGRLLPEHRLGRLRRYLSDPERRNRLLARTCVSRKPWYAFHETPPLKELLRPKLLCKDISPAAFFVPDRTGQVVPRHSVYYLVPARPECLDDLAEYLNSPGAQHWLRDHCQRAASSFLRVQSQVLKRLPLPQRFALFRKPATLQPPPLEAQSA